VTANELARREFARRDIVYFGARVLALGAGTVWAWSLEVGPMRDGVLLCFGLFVAYCALLYLAGLRMLRSGVNDTFYVVAWLSDLAFLAVVIQVSGGARSPFVAALPPWSALYASRFGLRGGLVSAGAALAITAITGAFGVVGHAVADPWRVVSQLAILGAQGPVLGFLFDLAGDEIRDAHTAQKELAPAHDPRVEERAELIEAEKHRSVAVLAAGLAQSA
jgi:hypothetical protein